LQDLLNLAVEVSLGILLTGIGIEVLLNLGHARVGFSAESELNLYESFEAWIEIWDTEIDELRELGEQLLVQLLVCCLGHLGLLLGAGELGDILVRLLNELLDLSTHGVIVQELVVALLDTWILSAVSLE
jgi:hypothetical protein